jgi:hypothetical protein
MTHPSLDTPSLQLFSDEIDFFDPKSISKKVSLVDAMAQAQIAYLFCVSLCTFFHREPDAVLLLLAPKHLEGPHSILNHEPHIAQIDTLYVQSMCQKWVEKEMFDELGFLTYSA